MAGDSALEKRMAPLRPCATFNNRIQQRLDRTRGHFAPTASGRSPDNEAAAASIM